MIRKRGSQYCSAAYHSELRRHGMRTSMSGRGNCYDNAPVESFFAAFGADLRFKTIKAEMIWRTVFQSRQHATAAIGRWIDGFLQPRPTSLDTGLRQPRRLRATRSVMNHWPSTVTGQVHGVRLVSRCSPDALQRTLVRRHPTPNLAGATFACPPL